MMVKLNGCIFWLKMINYENNVKVSGGKSINTGIKKEFDSEPIYKNNFQKFKINYYSDETSDFHDKEMLKAGSTLV